MPFSGNPKIIPTNTSLNTFLAATPIESLSNFTTPAAKLWKAIPPDFGCSFAYGSPQVVALQCMA